MSAISKSKIRAIIWTAVWTILFTSCSTHAIETRIIGYGFVDLNKDGVKDVGERVLFDYSVTAKLISSDMDPYYQHGEIVQPHQNGNGQYDLRIAAKIEVDPTTATYEEKDQVYQVSVKQIPEGYSVGNFNDVHTIDVENVEDYPSMWGCSQGPNFYAVVGLDIPFIPLEEGDLIGLPYATPTPTFTPEPTPTFTPEPTPTFTPEPTPTFTREPIPTFTREPIPTFTPDPRLTFTPTPVPSTSCDVYLDEKMSIFLHDFQPGPIYNLSLYIEWPDQEDLGPLAPNIPDGWPGVEIPMPNDPEPYIYTAQLGNIPSTGDCFFAGYPGKLHCNFDNLPQSMMDTAQVFQLWSNKCLDPIYTHGWVSIIAPDTPDAPPPAAPSRSACDVGLNQVNCNSAGGTYQCSIYSCACICP
ncbi:MAG: hypothetical protein ABFS17_12965 [Chloroflexota bacterium]